MFISEAIFLRKTEVVNLRTHWDMQKVSIAPQKLSRKNNVYRNKFNCIVNVFSLH